MNTPRRLLVATLVLIAAAGLAGCGGSAATQTPPISAPAAPAAATALPLTVSVSQAAQMRDDGAFVLDVREPDEWAAGHIADATLIPLGQLPTRLSEVPQDQPIVVVCRSGNRSAQGRDILLGAGFQSVTSMAGGMNDWAAAGLPVTTGS